MTTLKYGSTGSDVTQLQKLLNATGNYKLSESGNYDALTQNAVRDYQTRNGMTIDGIASDSLWNKLANGGDTAAQTSRNYTGTALDDAASKYANLQNNAPGAYQSAYGDQIQETIDAILNRGKFDYNAATDPMYKQYAEMFQRNGKLAMQDTMGQAAALTGGYGNSYAQMAGQSAYQQQLQGMNDVLPQLQQAALDRYNMENTDQMNQLSALQGAEASEYAKYRDQVGDYDSNLAQAYQEYQDAIANNQWQQNYNLSVAAKAASSGGRSGGSKKTDANALLDYAQKMVDSGAWTEAQATAWMNQAMGISTGGDSGLGSGAGTKLFAPYVEPKTNDRV